MKHSGLTCSVVMAAYNGHNFIEEQLQSLYQQTRAPDEVLISDDISTDDTAEIVSAFIVSKRLQGRWILYQNAKNKGILRNFFDTAAHAAGDIVFFADCDDIWLPQKIEVMMSGFETRTDMLACACLDYLVDGMGKRIRSLYDIFAHTSAGHGSFHKMSFADTVKYNQSAGHNLAVRRDFLAKAMPFIRRNGLVFDLPIGTLAAVYGGYYLLGQQMVAWRQHGTNSSGLKTGILERLSDLSGRINGQRQRLRQMQAVHDTYGKKINPADRETLREAIAWTEKSIKCLEIKDAKELFWMLFQKNRMMNWWISVNNFAVCIANL